MSRLPARRKRWLAAVTIGSVLFLSLGHHLLRFWERPALWMIMLLLIFVPLFVWGIFILLGRFLPHSERIPAWRLLLFCLAALTISSFITWRAYRPPVVYQSITIAPILTGEQILGLVELKADGAVLPIKKDALGNGWEKRGDILYAGADSRPLTISFRCPADSPVQVLFITAPQSGAADVSFEGSRVRTDLSASPGGASVQFRSTYRGIPGPVFAGILAGIDALAFGLLILTALIVQEIGQKTAVSEAANVFPSHRFSLTLLICLGALLHILNLLTSVLVLGPDSPAYLQGAVHLARFGNLDGVPVSRGPGTTFLFAPVIWLFGRNPWGLKIFLHLIALTCVPLCYHLGWLLGRNRWIALVSGLVAVFSPDLFVYANYVMADLPNLFFVLLFCNALLLALGTWKRVWIVAALAAASFTTLIRSEGLLLIAIGVAALGGSLFWQWRKGPIKQVRQPLLSLGLALVIALAPLLWWLDHNQRLYGFWGLSNYLGYALYDGWVYFGNASKLPFSDENSPAVQTLERVARGPNVVVTDASGVPTGGEIYQGLLKMGYTLDQAYDLMESATLDSIRKDPHQSLELLMLKFRTGLRPESIDGDYTYALPGEPPRDSGIKADFFDDESVSLPALIRLQRRLNQAIALWYPRLYPVWVLFCLLALSLSVFRVPAISWIALAITVFTRILISLTISVPFWRFTLSGWYPLQIAAICWLFLAAAGVKGLVRDRRLSDAMD